MSLPTLDSEGRIPIAVDQLIAHTLIQANSGGGKTVACRRILEQVWGAMPQWVLDPEGEMHTLRERHGHLLASPHGGDTVASVKTAPMLVKRLLETGASCVIDIYDLGVDERHEFVRVFAEAAMNQPRAQWRDVLVVLDEAHRYVPERGEDPSVAAGAVKNWMTAGRKRGYAMILAVQRLSTLHKSAAAECNNRLIGRTGLDTDQDRAGKTLGLRRPEDREALAYLKPGRFWVYGPAFCERPTQATIGQIHTSHGRSVRGKAPTPPLEEARRYLAQIGDLPAEAEAEIKTMEQLKARVAELDTEVRVLRSRAGEEPFSAAERKELNEKLAAGFAANRKRDEEHAAVRVKLAEAQTAAKRLQNRLLEISPIIVDHAKALASIGEDLIAKLMPDVRADVELVTRPWSISTPDEIIGDIALIADSAEVSATSRINGAAGPAVAVAPRARQPGGLAAMERAFLTVLAQHGRLPKAKVLLHANYAKSGNTSACFARLTEHRWISAENGHAEITPGGLRALGDYAPLPTGHALLVRILGNPHLNTMEKRILQVVCDAYPKALPKLRVLELAGYAKSGNTSAAFAHLCALDYCKAVDRGSLVAAKELCNP